MCATSFVLRITSSMKLYFQKGIFTSSFLRLATAALNDHLDNPQVVTAVANFVAEVAGLPPLPENVQIHAETNTKYVWILTNGGLVDTLRVAITVKPFQINTKLNEIIIPLGTCS